MEGARINALLPADSIFRHRISLHDRVTSTNDILKELALSGAPEGTVLLAEEQTCGRGTHGRTFSSHRGKGLYLSLLLRPQATLAELLTLTGRMAVAVREGIEAACGAPVAIKWLNDILLKGRKVCGILTELGQDFVVVGIGVNLSQTAGDFCRDGLENIAVSLEGAGYPVSRAELTAAILNRVEHMYRTFPQKSEEALEQYRAHCTTPGQAVSFRAEGTDLRGIALGIGDDFSLSVRDSRGEVRSLFSGTVAIL